MRAGRFACARWCGNPWSDSDHWLPRAPVGSPARGGVAIRGRDHCSPRARAPGPSAASPPPSGARAPTSRRGRLGRAQPRDEYLEQRPRHLGVRLDEGAELALRDAPAAHVGLGRDVRRAPAAVDERDLAEEVVPAQVRGRPVDRAYYGLALGDDEEPGPGRAALVTGAPAS